MNNRWYAKKQLEVSLWDGLTDFQVEETDREREQRLEKWEKFLEEDDSEKQVHTCSQRRVDTVDL